MKLLDILFCDDIRRELYNKFSLMGLYNDRLILNVNKQAKVAWPQPLNLCALLIFSFSTEDRKKQANRFEFEYLLNNESKLKMSNELNIVINEGFQFQIAIGSMSIPIMPGDLGFSIKLYKDKELIFSEKNEKKLTISVREI